MTKQELYCQIEFLRKKIGIVCPPPYDSKVLCTAQFGLNLDMLDLRTSKLRGMSHIPSRSVVIDCKRTPEEQNFHCMHEIMHHVFHRNRSTKSYSSYDTTQADQDPFIEWQANEGAAQFLLPYQRFIPDYIQVSKKLAHKAFSQLRVIEILSDKYFVSEKVISNRIDSLNYEIYQVLNNADIAKVRLCSKAYLTSIEWYLRHEKTFCCKCLEPIAQDYFFCPVCGGVVNDGHPLHRLGMVNTGAGYMIYKGIELNSNGQPKLCPFCKNEEHLKSATHCMICGKPATNQCTFALQDNVPSEYQQCTHLEPLPGNARYCPYCGAKTTFLESELLRSWDKSFTTKDEDIPY